jgi:hypothetical protein
MAYPTERRGRKATGLKERRRSHGSGAAEDGTPRQHSFGRTAKVQRNTVPQPTGGLSMAPLPNIRTARSLVVWVVVWSAAGGISAFAAPLFEPIEGSPATTLADADRRVHVRLDPYRLSALSVGEKLTVVLPGVGKFDYVVQRRSVGLSLVLVDACLASDPNQRLALGVRPHGVDGFIDTPSGAYVLRHASGMHWVATASHDDRETASVMPVDSPGAPELKIGVSARR